MSATKDDILTVLRDMRTELTNLQGKLSDVMRYVADLPLNDQRPRHTCDACKRVFPSLPELQEHAYIHHDGPLPDRDRAAATLAGEAARPRDQGLAAAAATFAHPPARTDQTGIGA